MGVMSLVKRLLGSASKEPESASTKLRDGSAELDYAAATAELERGENLTHGLRHLASLLSFDPARAEWLQLLPRYRAASGDRLLEMLDPGTEQGHFALEALRPRLLAEAGELERASALLVEVVIAKPDARYLETWGLDWWEPDGALESLSPATAANALMVTVRSLPAPNDATANAVRQAMDDPMPPFSSEDVDMTLSDVESPSNMVAFGLLMRRHGFSADMKLTYQHIATPDPREPVEPTAYRLWRRDGEVLRPDLEPPTDDVAREIAELTEPRRGTARSGAGARSARLRRPPAGAAGRCRRLHLGVPCPAQRVAGAGPPRRRLGG